MERPKRLHTTDLLGDKTGLHEGGFPLEDTLVQDGPQAESSQHRHHREGTLPTPWVTRQVMPFPSFYPRRA